MCTHNETKKERDGHIDANGEVVDYQNALGKDIRQKTVPRVEVEQDRQKVDVSGTTKHCLVYVL